MEKRIIHLDASVLKQSACSRLFYLSLLKGYRPALNDISIEFGQAFHHFAKHVIIEPALMRQHLQEAMKYFRETPHSNDKKKKHLTEGYLAKICTEWYLGFHAVDSFNILKDTKGAPVVEHKFRIPYYEDDHCIIYLTGTMDKLCVHTTSKILCVGDYKTTGAWDKDEYLSQYDLSGQLSIYTIALQKHIEMSTPDSVLYLFRGKPTGVFIEGVFLRSSGEVEFQRSSIRMSYEMPLESVRTMLDKKCDEISKMVWLSNEEDYMPTPDGMLNGACQLFFGPCKFFQICCATDKRAQKAGLERNFIQRMYNPLNFAGKGDEEYGTKN
jgi:hypothetical protein